MDNINSNIKLYLPKVEGISSLKTQVFKEELEQINEKFPLEENQISIRKTYILNHKDSLEVGFIIRSTIKNSIAIEDLNLGILDKDKRVVISQVFNFKEVGAIPPYSGVPFSVNFNKINQVEFENMDDYSVEILESDDLQGFLSIDPEIENLPTNLSFEEEKEIFDFMYNLETLHVNEVYFSLFKLIKLNDGSISVDIIIRNGYNTEIKLEQFPILIANDNDIVVARNIFEDSNGIVKVSPHKAKLLKFTLGPSNIYLNDYDISKCKVMFK